MKEKILLKNRTIKILILLLLAFLTTCAFCVNLKITGGNIDNPFQRILIEIYTSFDGYKLSTIPLFIAFYYLYSKWYFDGTKINKVAVVLSILISAFMVLGYSFKTTNTWILVFYNKFQFLKSVFVMLGYYTMIYIIIKKLYIWLDASKFGKLEIKKKTKLAETIFEKHPFIIPFIIILIMWLPYIISFYPGTIVHVDTRDQIYQFHHIQTNTINNVKLISDEVYINNHHPVLHTLIINGFVKIGEIIGNYNVGMFFYTIVQVIIMISVLSYTFVYMKKKNIPIWVRIFALFLYTLLSFFPLSAINFSKDAYASIFTIIYIILLFELITNDVSFCKKRYYILLIAIMLLIMLFRNDGIYRVVIPFIVLIFMNRKYWKKLIIILLIPVIIFQIYNNIILPAFKITKGSIRETMSIPFQQTSRVLWKYGDNAFTEEEQEKINKILDYKSLKEIYYTENSDKVKEVFNKNYKKEELLDYLKVWIKNFFKYPLTYIEATLGNTYGYFYTDISAKPLKIGYTYESDIDDGIFNIQFESKFENARNNIIICHNTLSQIPVISMFYSMGFHINILLIAIGYIVHCKKYEFMPALLPLFVAVLVALASPVNAYLRYVLPIILNLPMTIAIIIYISQMRYLEKHNKFYS